MKNEKRCTGITVPVQQADDLNLSCAKNAPDTQPQYISQEQIAQAKVARYLGHGEGNALRAADLCNRVGYRSTRTLRAAIARERRAGIPILSSNAGYFLPDAGEKGQREAAAFCRSLRSSAVNVFRAASAAWKYLGVLPEQIAMEERDGTL